MTTKAVRLNDDRVERQWKSIKWFDANKGLKMDKRGTLWRWGKPLYVSEMTDDEYQIWLRENKITGMAAAAADRKRKTLNKQ